ncbi:MAG: hypothetical protein M5R41_05105 [Bacteroidia bacterium]|nr:hypothetical protein [Bacteroidia bacterium]
MAGGVGILLWLALCGAVAVYASNKGLSALGLFMLSFFFTPLVGIIVAISSEPGGSKSSMSKVGSGDLRPCAKCSKGLRPEERVCRYCGTDLSIVFDEEKKQIDSYILAGKSALDIRNEMGLSPTGVVARFKIHYGTHLINEIKVQVGDTR